MYQATKITVSKAKVDVYYFVKKYCNRLGAKEWFEEKWEQGKQLIKKGAKTVGRGIRKGFQKEGRVLKIVCEKGESGVKRSEFDALFCIHEKAKPKKKEKAKIECISLTNEFIPWNSVLEFDSVWKEKVTDEKWKGAKEWMERVLNTCFDKDKERKLGGCCKVVVEARWKTRKWAEIAERFGGYATVPFGLIIAFLLAYYLYTVILP